MPDSGAEPDAALEEASEQPGESNEPSFDVTKGRELPSAHDSRQSASQEQSAPAETISIPPVNSQLPPIPIPGSYDSHPEQPRSSSAEQSLGRSPPPPSPPPSLNGPPSGATDLDCSDKAAHESQSDATQSPSCTAADGAQPEAAAEYGDLFAPHAPFDARAIAAPTQSSFELVPGLPPVVIDVPPGFTPEQAQARAAVIAGLIRRDPPRRKLKDLYPDWDDTPDRLILEDVPKVRPVSVRPD